MAPRRKVLANLQIVWWNKNTSLQSTKTLPTCKSANAFCIASSLDVSESSFTTRSLSTGQINEFQSFQIRTLLTWGPWILDDTSSRFGCCRYLLYRPCENPTVHPNQCELADRRPPPEFQLPSSRNCESTHGKSMKITISKAFIIFVEQFTR